MSSIFFHTIIKLVITNTKFQPIPQTLKKMLKNKLSIGVPVKYIYMEIRDSHANYKSRTRLHPEDNTTTYA